MVRSRNVLALEEAPEIASKMPRDLAELAGHPAFSALCCLQGNQIIMEAAAPDFSTTRPHSIQSISKMHIHLIAGWLLQRGKLSLEAKVRDYLPEMGSGYAEATVQSLLDMTVTNDFTEDYSDPLSDCYAEEIALAWRLPAQHEEEISLEEFASSITGFEQIEPLPIASYKSANTDVLTLIAAAISPVSLPALIEQIADAAGYEGAFHISCSKDGHPAFSGGGCLSARDLARFGQLFARQGRDLSDNPFANARFLESSLSRQAPQMSPPKDWLNYSNHLMTDGRVLGHAGYGGQFLLVDVQSGTSCAFLSVLENDSGYDDVYMGQVADTLRRLCCGEL